MITSVVSFDLKRCSFGADKGLFLDQIFGEFPLPFTNNDFMDLHMRQNLLSLIVMFPFFFLLSFPFTSSVVICPVVFVIFLCISMLYCPCRFPVSFPFAFCCPFLVVFTFHCIVFTLLFLIISCVLWHLSHSCFFFHVLYLFLYQFLFLFTSLERSRSSTILLFVLHFQSWIPCKQLHSSMA